MTLDDAIRLQELWKAKHNQTICKHTQIFEFLRSEDGRKAGSLICLVCGEVYTDSQK